ncbi:MAG TPA: glycosyltransferase family 4 protein [Candidatus Paceibacterota bacterium]|nr:glycosyltransferase family 4 protein [Candidatus Paceibacterota bacterium]
MAPEINLSQVPSQGPKKRVFFLVTQSEFGGAQQFLFRFIEKLRRRPFELIVAVGADGDNSFSQAIGRLGVEVLTIPSLRREPSYLTDLGAIWAVRKVIKKFHPDTVFLNSSKAGFIGSLAARLASKRINVVYRIGGWSFNDPRPALERWLYRQLEKFSARWKDYIIVNNLHDQQQADKLKIKPRKQLLLVHNGIDPYGLQLLSREEARGELFRAMNTEDQSQKIIGTIANFYPAKGLEYLLEAAEQSTEDKIFCVIGDGDERPKLEKIIADKNLSKKVSLIGKRDQASQYLAGFDVFVLSSVKEGFPWALLEAMSAKLPVVATAVGAVPEMIDDGTNGYLVPPRNALALTEAIAKILSNELKAKEMGIQAHQKVLFSFSAETMTDSIARLL